MVLNIVFLLNPQEPEGVLDPLLGGEEGAGEDAKDDEAPTPSLWASLQLLLSNPEVLSFFMMATLMGLAKGTIDTFLFLYLDELGKSKSLAFCFESKSYD